MLISHYHNDNTNGYTSILCIIGGWPQLILVPRPRLFHVQGKGSGEHGQKAWAN